MPRVLTRSVRKGKGDGHPLPDPFPGLTQPDFKVRFRRGELSIVAAEPGDGKSAFALVAAVRMGVPTMYVSADSSSHEQANRLLSLATGKMRDEVEPWLETHPDWCAEQLAQYGHIQWCFESAPSLQTLEEEIDSYIVAHGEPPELIVIDNISDVVGEGEGEWADLRSIPRDLKLWARFYNTHVMALHHTSEKTNARGEAERPNPVPNRARIQGKISAVPALVLTLTSDAEGMWMNVCPVKSRSGPSYPKGDRYVQFIFEPSTMAIRDLSEGQS